MRIAYTLKNVTTFESETEKCISILNIFAVKSKRKESFSNFETIYK